MILRRYAAAVVLVSFLWCADIFASELAPSFLQPGLTYVAEGFDEPFEVIQIGEEGWIQVRSKGEELWLNTKIIPSIKVVDPEKEAERARMRSTLADIRAIGMACEAFAVDNEVYPAGDTLIAITAQLQPTYIRKLPLKDAWGNKIIYLTDSHQQNYWIISDGPDKRRNELLYDAKGKPLENLNSESKTGAVADDIIFSQGLFLNPPGVP